MTKKYGAYMQDVKSIIAKNITELRLSHNMTQMDLAEELHYSNKTVSKWERAESSPDIGVLVEIADLFGVTVTNWYGKNRKKKARPCKRKNCRDTAAKPLRTYRKARYG